MAQGIIIKKNIDGIVGTKMPNPAMIDVNINEKRSALSMILLG